jgi:hypothetical protein
LNPSNQSVDWDELLRKFSKHNSSQAAHVVAASTRLELIIWRALQLQTGLTTHNAQPRSRKTSITQSHGLETDGTAAASFPRDFLIDSTTKRKDIELQIQELQKAVTLTGGQTPESVRFDISAKPAVITDDISTQTSHTAVLGLAYFSIGNTSESAQCLRIQQGASAPFTAAPDAPTHELDLQILSMVLKGDDGTSQGYIAWADDGRQACCKNMRDRRRAQSLRIAACLARLCRLYRKRKDT